jgi:hypothetical protein
MQTAKQRRKTATTSQICTSVRRRRRGRKEDTQEKYNPYSVCLLGLVISFQEYIFKLGFADGTTRRFELATVSLEEFKEQLQQFYPSEYDPSTHIIQYDDPEGVRCTVGIQQEWERRLQDAEQVGKDNDKPRLVRLLIQPSSAVANEVALSSSVPSLLSSVPSVCLSSPLSVSATPTTTSNFSFAAPQNVAHNFVPRRRGRMATVVPSTAAISLPSASVQIPVRASTMENYYHNRNENQIWNGTKIGTSNEKKKFLQTKRFTEKDKEKNVVHGLASSSVPVPPSRSPAVKLASHKSHLSTPVKKVICFSGFVDGTEYNTAMRKDLSVKVKALHGDIRITSEFDNKITHVVAPPNSRTMKILAAALTGRWLIDPKWVIDSAAAGHFLNESLYGKKYSERPFEGKRFYLSEIFKVENKTKISKLQNATILITLGKGTIVPRPDGEVHYTLVGSRVAPKDVYGQPLTWNQFIYMIPGAESPPN